MQRASLFINVVLDGVVIYDREGWGYLHKEWI